MPVRAHDLDRNAVIAADPCAESLYEKHDQRDDPSQHMHRMQPRNDIKELPRPGSTKSDPAIPDMSEPDPLQDHKEHTQYRRRRDQVAVLPHFPILERTQRHLHRQAAHQDHGRGIPQSTGDRKTRPTRRIPLDDIGAGKTRKHHDDAGQPHP